MLQITSPHHLQVARLADGATCRWCGDIYICVCVCVCVAGWWQVPPTSHHPATITESLGYLDNLKRGVVVVVVRTASERRENHLKRFKDFYLKVKALTVLYVPYLLDIGRWGKGVGTHGSRFALISREESVVIRARGQQPWFICSTATRGRGGAGSFASLEAQNTVKSPLHVNCTASTTIIHPLPGTKRDI